MEGELRGRVKLALPPAHVIEICHDKYVWLRFARAAGVHCPPFGTASDLPQLAALIAEIGYPVVIRPTESGKKIGMRKAVTLFGEDDFAAAFAAWPEGLSELLVQRRFTGDRYNSYFVAQDGRMVCEQQSRSLRTDRADGTGQTVEGITVAPIATLSSDLEKVVARMGYTGVGCAQFLLDAATGESCFLEINPRFGASYAFIERAGLELTRLAVELANGSMHRSVSTPYTFDEGTRFVSTFDDLAGLTYSVAKREVGLAGALRWLGAALLAAFRADVHVTWSVSDPLPAIAVPFWRFARSFTQGKSMLEP
jgi:biotin carboxylase